MVNAINLPQNATSASKTKVVDNMSVSVKNHTSQRSFFVYYV
jgi:hypothetical protein